MLVIDAATSTVTLPSPSASTRPGWRWTPPPGACYVTNSGDGTVSVIDAVGP